MVCGRELQHYSCFELEFSTGFGEQLEVFQPSLFRAYSATPR